MSLKANGLCLNEWKGIDFESELELIVVGRGVMSVVPLFSPSLFLSLAPLLDNHVHLSEPMSQKMRT